MGESLKVAWFGHARDRRGNGRVTYSREMTKALQAAGAEVQLFYHRRSAAPPPLGSIPLRALRLTNDDLLSTPASHARVRQWVRSAQPDVAHVSLSFSFSMDRRLPDLFHKANIPIVATLHFGAGKGVSVWTVLAKIVHQVYIPVFHQYDALVVLGDFARETLRQAGVPDQRVHVIPNAVDIRVFCPGPTTYKAEVGARWLAAYCGRVDPEKRVDVLL
ncbi:MAG: glycosyltransferase family 4 protein, partial [Chloroflexi bacterium]|nr:glycosyltransferase family 4 protein [Chloroflexota bacterium]